MLRGLSIVLALLLGGCAEGWPLIACGSGKCAPRDLAVKPLADQAPWLQNRVFFALDSSEVGSDAAQTATWLAALLRTYPDLEFMLEGHADERGTREYNLALGQRRADAVRDYLLALGIAGDRLATVSWGKERPAVLGGSEAAWAFNRRVVVHCRADRDPARAATLCRYFGDSPLNHDDGTEPSWKIVDGKLIEIPAKVRIGIKQ
ncbi:OmpA family protein [Lacibacterium aquatile]|uniref:OmpA family protein n=1 Tax=Lacibacterium aquatile TaxID=1168082 RepID=A0ABW5DSZ7_9PROT